MKQLNVDLKNCYGIKELSAKFDFDGCKANAIYAPNGAMKSSLAKTFQDLAANTASKDRIFPARECARSIKDEKRIASIPFIRNLLEFTKGDADPDFVKLTSLLHWKSGSAAITQGDLDQVYDRLFGSNGQKTETAASSVVDLVHKSAKECMTADEGINFENKIVLSIAVRLGAEQFMVTKIADQSFTDGIGANQTSALVRKFREKFPNSAAIDTVQKVMLMTPENIHLNSFMYEPILDMSDEHLRKLYGEVLALA